MALKIGISGFATQLPPPASGKEYSKEYRESIELVQLAEAYGFDSAWVHEHHGTSDGFMSALLPTLAAWAGVTRRMSLGTAVLLAPFYDPLRLAEDAAAVDLFSDGRLVLGLGIGWREEEFRMFRIPRGERVQRTVETIEVLRLAWTGDRFSFSGQVFDFDAVRITPAPSRIGGPPIYIGAAAPAGIARSGRIGDGFIGTQYTTIEQMKQELSLAEEHATQAGKDPKQFGYARLQNAFVWQSDENRWDRIRRGVAHQIGAYPGWRTGADTPGSGFEIVEPTEEEMRRLTPAGSPEQVIDRLAPIVEAFRHKDEFHLILRIHFPGMAFEESALAIELFGTDVIPALRIIDAGDKLSAVSS